MLANNQSHMGTLQTPNSAHLHLLYWPGVTCTMSAYILDLQCYRLGIQYTLT